MPSLLLPSHPAIFCRRCPRPSARLTMMPRMTTNLRSRWGTSSSLPTKRMRAGGLASLTVGVKVLSLSQPVRSCLLVPTGHSGVFPSNFVAMLPDEEDHHAATAAPAPAKPPPPAAAPAPAPAPEPVVEDAEEVVGLVHVPCATVTHIPSPQVKPKKPVGMGFGNIFQGGVPTLKKNSNRFSFHLLF